MVFLFKHKCPKCGSELPQDSYGNNCNCQYCGSEVEINIKSLDESYSKACKNIEEAKFTIADSAFDCLIEKEPYNSLYWRGKFLSLLNIQEEQNIFTAKVDLELTRIRVLLDKVPQDHKAYFSQFYDCVELQKQITQLNEDRLPIMQKIECDTKVLCGNKQTNESTNEVEDAGKESWFLSDKFMWLVVFGTLLVFVLLSGNLGLACVLLIFLALPIVFKFLISDNVDSALTGMTSKFSMKDDADGIAELRERLENNEARLKDYNARIEEITESRNAKVTNLQNLRDNLIKDYCQVCEDSVDILSEPDSDESYICPNCGTELKFDDVLQKYECNSCGGVFDNTYVTEFMRTARAYDLLEQGLYDDAKSEFIQIIEKRTSDAVAFNGLILATMNARSLDSNYLNNLDQVSELLDKYLSRMPYDNKQYFKSIPEYGKLKNKYSDMCQEPDFDESSSEARGCLAKTMNLYNQMMKSKPDVEKSLPKKS